MLIAVGTEEENKQADCMRLMNGEKRSFVSERQWKITATRFLDSWNESLVFDQQ